MENTREMLPMLVKNPYLGAAGLIVVSFGLAFLIDFIVARVFRGLTRRTRVTWDDQLLNALHRPVKTTVFLFGLWLAAARLTLPPTPEAITAAILKTILALVWTVFAIRVIGVVANHLANSGSRVVDLRTKPLFVNVARIVIVAFAVYFVFLFWKIDVTAWMASAGIIGIAVGFAAKDTLANLFSGIFILADAPYKVGDFIVLDSGERGEVTHIGLRSTRLVTRDDVEVTLPNALIANAKIINESGGPHLKERIRCKVGVAYGSDVDRVREVLEEIGKAHPDTCEHPEPRVRFRTMGEYSLDFELLCWVDEPVLRGRILDELNTQVYKALARENIEIPYPKRDIYIKETPTPNALGGPS